ncbi:hypothetical protein An02g02450 [Aspergillus niger]|uniref:Uncharacterized protein n=2 Tax=Aspergillus niger TaxID=5061 RepID=A2QC66_ASPNC|nr:hypothetical protein An02g02450 [Aspergillus niger]CAK37526.1 hypothetical protein An02g02450 [Aspergillus niger]
MRFADFCSTPPWRVCSTSLLQTTQFDCGGGSKARLLLGPDPPELPNSMRVTFSGLTSSRVSMGDPVYPRLLVNPDKNLVAVIGQDAIDRPGFVFVGSANGETVVGQNLSLSFIVLLAIATVWIDIGHQPHPEGFLVHLFPESNVFRAAQCTYSPVRRALVAIIRQMQFSGYRQNRALRTPADDYRIIVQTPHAESRIEQTMLVIEQDINPMDSVISSADAFWRERTRFHTIIALTPSKMVICKMVRAMACSICLFGFRARLKGEEALMSGVRIPPRAFVRLSWVLVARISFVARTDAVEEGIIEKEGGLVYGARWSLYSQVQNYLGEYSMGAVIEIVV